VGSRKGALAAAGIINGMGSIGPVFQEQIVGWMYKAYDRSLTPVLLMLLSMSLLCTVLTFVLYRRARQGKANI
jgi:nitrate/nitrite transporter NarK